jgi:hypothetical protein
MPHVRPRTRFTAASRVSKAKLRAVVRQAEAAAEVDRRRAVGRPGGDAVGEFVQERQSVGERGQVVHHRADVHVQAADRQVRRRQRLDQVLRRQAELRTRVAVGRVALVLGHGEVSRQASGIDPHEQPPGHLVLADGVGEVPQHRRAVGDDRGAVAEQPFRLRDRRRRRVVADASQRDAGSERGRDLRARCAIGAAAVARDRLEHDG